MAYQGRGSGSDLPPGVSSKEVHCRSFKNNNKADSGFCSHYAQLLLNNVKDRIVLSEKNLLMVKF